MVYEQRVLENNLDTGNLEDLFQEGSRFKQKNGIDLRIDSDPIGTLRKRTDALPSAPKIGFLTNCSFK
jgi:hypothetical protein